MNLLYYSDLDYSTVEKKFKKVEKMLAKGDFKSADVKKLKNTPYYRAKLDDTNRLLFKFAEYDNNTYLLLLEIILNHDYEKSKFLRGYSVDENKLEVIATEKEVKSTEKEKLRYVNRKNKTIHILDKYLSFDDSQNEVYNLPAPLIIIGSAGSGKTVLTLEKLKTLPGSVAYISLSPFLVENAQNIYSANDYDNPNQEIDFLSFKEFIDSVQIPKGTEIQFRQFEKWFVKYMQNSKVDEPFRLFEEFKGVLTGSVVDAPYLSKNDYINLGVKQSVFTQKQRKDVYEIFQKYLKFLEESAYFDLNILAYEYLKNIPKRYDYVVVDEVQDITNIQLKCILQSLKKAGQFILTGDSNQIVHPNFFSWSKVKSMFYLDKQHYNTLRILTVNYRNSQTVTQLSNWLLKIKNSRFGSIDRESTYLIDTISPKKGEVHLLKDNKKSKKDLNSKTQNSTKYAVLVMNNADKAKAAKFFKTPLLFSIQEAKGLEYENIILYNFVSGYTKEFFEVTKGVEPDELEENDLRYARARNKEDKDLEVYKFFINSLYVAFTRAVQNLFIIEESTNHQLYKLLKLSESREKVKIDAQKSGAEEWLEEARKLELQGKYEQAEQIRAKVLGTEYLTPEALEALKRIALDPEKTEQEVKRERKQLFRYAESRKMIDIIEQLAEINYLKAIAFMKEVKEYRKNLLKATRLDRDSQLPIIIKKYGVDFTTDEDGMAGLALSVFYNSTKSFQLFVKNRADKRKVTDSGKTPLQIAYQAFWEMLYEAKHQNTMTIPSFKLMHSKLMYPFIRVEIQDKRFKITNKSMEFFLLNFMNARHTEKQFRQEDGTYVNAMRIQEFVDFTEALPPAVLPAYRRKRQYINSILANNEIDRDFVYNKQLFKRVARGVYALNPDLQLSYR